MKRYMINNSDKLKELVKTFARTREDTDEIPVV